jgi:hypothetical protein
MFNKITLRHPSRAVAEAVSRWLPTATAPVRVRTVHVGFVINKAALGQVFSEYSVSPANHHSTNFSSIIFIRGWYSRSIGGRSAVWTQLDSILHYTNLELI